MRTNPLNSGKLRASVRGVIGTAVAVPLLFSAMPAMAQSEQDQMQQLRNEIQQMQQRMDSMQQRQQAAQQTAGDNSSSMVSKSPDGEGFMVGKTQIKINGYIKADAVYDFQDDHGVSLGPSDAIGSLRGKGTDHPSDEHIGMSVNQTRLKLATTTPTAIGDVGGYIEMDFFGNGGGFDDGPSPRVRRAYFTVGNWLFGRDWTTFSDFNYGTTLNFYGPQAQIFERQAQVRYSLPVDDNTTLDIALENPSGGGVQTGAPGSPGTPAVTDPGLVGLDTHSKAPDFVMRLKSKAGPASFQVAGIARYLTADIDDGSLKGDEDSVFGWGLDVGATLALPTGTTLMGSVVGGKGIGKYIYAPAGGSDLYVKQNGDLEAYKRWGFIGTLSQELTETLTGNVVYGKAYSEDPDNVAYSTDTLHDESSTLAVNLLYTPVDPLTFGIEWNRSTYEQQNGVDADANNIQVSTIYNF